ncbi:MAG: phosphoadenylyl-sulfate reductase [Synechococcales cyanobacterium]
MTSVLSSSALNYQSEIESLSQQFEVPPATEVLKWAANEFGHSLVLACSFGPEDLVLIDLLTQVQPDAHAFFLDTDFHFAETLELKEQIQNRYPRLQLHTVKPLFTPEEQAAQYGEALYRSNPDQCCYIRKVEPMNRVLQPYEAWITGMRREQAVTRANIGKVQWDAKRDKLKLNPLADWTEQQVWAYITKHEIPYNALHDQNFPSIGCFHCTAPVAPGADPRSGRWQGKQKVECGLHV